MIRLKRGKRREWKSGTESEKQFPFHLADVPQVQTYINCYDKHPETLEALVEKLLGRSEFKGVSPVDAFCGYPDTRI